jgi:hypothetical protein
VILQFSADNSASPVNTAAWKDNNLLTSKRLIPAAAVVKLDVQMFGVEAEHGDRSQ